MKDSKNLPTLDLRVFDVEDMLPALYKVAVTLARGC